MIGCNREIMDTIYDMRLYTTSSSIHSWYDTYYFPLEYSKLVVSSLSYYPKMCICLSLTAPYLIYVAHTPEIVWYFVGYCIFLFLLFIPRRMGKRNAAVVYNSVMSASTRAGHPTPESIMNAVDTTTTDHAF